MDGENSGRQCQQVLACVCVMCAQYIRLSACSCNTPLCVFVCVSGDTCEGSEVEVSDILISKTKTKTRMIDFSNTETKTNTKTIMKTETI